MQDLGEETPCGLLMGCSAKLLLSNVVFSLIVCAWVFANMSVFFTALKFFKLHRIPLLSEAIGMDATYFNSRDNAGRNSVGGLSI